MTTTNAMPLLAARRGREDNAASAPATYPQDLERKPYAFGGVLSDYSRRFPLYLSDITDSFTPKTISAAVFSTSSVAKCSSTGRAHARRYAPPRAHARLPNHARGVAQRRARARTAPFARFLVLCAALICSALLCSVPICSSIA